MSGQITRKDIITDDALQWSKEYGKTLDEAIAKNKEFVDSIILLNAENVKLRRAENQTEFLKQKNEVRLLTEKANSAIKEQLALETSAEKIRQEAIRTEKLALDVEAKKAAALKRNNTLSLEERVLNEAKNKALKLQARENAGLVGTYEKLNRLRTESQKRLADLLAAENRNTAAIKAAKLEYDKLDARVKAVDETTRNYTKNIGNYKSAFDGLNSTMREVLSTFGLVTGIALFGTIVKDAFNTIKEFDRQLIAVGKTTNISGEDLKAFGREVVLLGDQLDGISVQGLLQSAEVAGTLGVKGTDNILKFSTAIEKLKLTSDIISEEQVQNFAKFIEVSSDGFENADKLASVITQLGNNFATTEAQILGNSTEIQKGIAVYNTSAQGVLALGAATSSLGSEAESSRSAIQSTFAIINDAVATGKNLENVLKLTGLTQKELSDQFNKDATGVFQKFVKGLNTAKNEGENLSLVLEDLGLTEKRAFTVVGSLAANYSVLENAMISAKQEYIDNIALNKEVEAASQSVSSIIGDIKDRFDAYILTANDANDGTRKIASALKFVRDNLSGIIEGFIKYGSVLLTFLAVQKAVSFATGVWTALKVAGTAAQISFTTATGIGTAAMKAQALAAQQAAASQTALNVATKATPWGIILAAVSAVVVAYIAFNEQLTENEILVEKITAANKRLADSEKTTNEQSDQFRDKRFKQIEQEIELRRAQGENSKKLDDEESARKKKIIQDEIDTFNQGKKFQLEFTKSEIKNSEERIKQAEAEKSALIKANFRRSANGNTVDDLDETIKNEKEKVAIKSSLLRENSKLTITEQQRLAAALADLDKNKAIKDAENQTEQNKKAIEDRKKRLKEIFDLEKKAQDDDFKLRQFRLGVAIDVENEIANNEKKNLDDRIEALLSFQQLKAAKTKEAAEFELQQLGKYNESSGKFVRQLSDNEIKALLEGNSIKKKITNEQRLVIEKYQNEVTESARKNEEARRKIIDAEVEAIQKRTDAEIQLQTNQQNRDIVGENNRYADELEAAGENFKLIEAAREEHERRILAIQKKYALEAIQLQIDNLQSTLDNNDSKDSSEQISAEKRAEIVAKLEQFRREASDLTTEKIKENAEITVEQQKQINERLIDLGMSLKDALTDLTNAIFDARISNIDAEIERNNEYYDAEIAKAGDNERQKKLLEAEREKKNAELEKKRKKEAYKAAVFNKVMALAEIAINTAIAISKVAAQTGIFALAGIGPIIALGAIQAATVLATPLPKYKHGRKDGPDEFAVVGDGGRREVISDADGSNPEITPNKPTVMFLRRKQKVHRSVEDYKKYMRDSFLSDIEVNHQKAKEFQANISVNNENSDLLEEMKLTRKTFERMKTNVTVNVPKNDINHQLWKFKNTNW
jgi:hypothetical protein